MKEKATSNADTLEKTRRDLDLFLEIAVTLSVEVRLFERCKNILKKVAMAVLEEFVNESSDCDLSTVKRWRGI